MSNFLKINSSVWEKIYVEKRWQGGSGPGSIPESALPWIAFVNNFIRENNVQSVLDLGSGDGRIFLHINLNGANYTGVEASKKAISMFMENNPNFDGNIINSDLLSTEYPKTDLGLIKDVLQHNTYEDVFNILNKAKESCTYLLICEDFTKETLPDIKSGEWRPINFYSGDLPIKTKTLFTYGLSDPGQRPLKGVYLYSLDSKYER
jgi:SAM-dependent methyltransferase